VGLIVARKNNLPDNIVSVGFVPEKYIFTVEVRSAGACGPSRHGAVGGRP
jgi:hypothetical protein